MWYNQPMKKMNRTTDNLIRILLALLIGTLMCFCMCACGGDSNTEETIEITTPSQEGAEPAVFQPEMLPSVLTILLQST